MYGENYFKYVPMPIAPSLSMEPTIFVGFRMATQGRETVTGEHIVDNPDCGLMGVLLCGAKIAKRLLKGMQAIEKNDVVFCFRLGTIKEELIRRHLEKLNMLRRERPRIKSEVRVNSMFAAYGYAHEGIPIGHPNFQI